MSRAFVTGASGHLGANLVRELVARGDRVRVLVRREREPAIEGLDVEVVVGDLSNEETLTRALAGCDRLYHLAALISIRDADRSALHTTNVEGTRRVLQAALHAGVERVVHCSSFGAVGQRPGRASDERMRLRHDEPAMDYDRTKAAAEGEVARALARGLDVRVVCPSGMVGPWDYKPSLIGDTMLAFARGRLPAYVSGGHDFVPVSCVARGHVLAMERGRTGERYLLTGAYTTLDEIFEWMAEILGRRAPRLRIPPKVALPVAAIKDRLERALAPGRRPKFNEQSIRMLAAGKVADGSWTRASLAWSPGSVRDAVAEHIDWFRAQGRL